MTGRKISNAHRRRGSELVEFALVSFLLFSVIFAVFEFGRMVLVYNSIANAARVGVRFAEVHGSQRTPPTTLGDICGVVTSRRDHVCDDTGAPECQETTPHHGA